MSEEVLVVKQIRSGIPPADMPDPYELIVQLQKELKDLKERVVLVEKSNGEKDKEIELLREGKIVHILDLDHYLKKTGNWKASDRVRKPIARKVGNIVQFSGCIDSVNHGRVILKEIPQEFRPQVQQIFSVTVNDNLGSSNGVLRFRVESNGDVTVEGVQLKRVTRIFLAPVMYFVS